MQYLGHLSRHDPLFEYLRWDILPQLGCDGRDGIRVFGTNSSNEVYIYEDRHTNTKLVGKFFYMPEKNNWEHSLRLLDREYRNINLVRNFISYPHYAAKALGRNDSLNRLLVVEYCYGEFLDSVILRSINSCDDGLLFDKLRTLGWFLAELHNNSARNEGVAFDDSLHYFDCITGNLRGIISDDEAHYLRQLRESWRSDWAMWSDCKVLVHGDATPSNFCFGNGDHVITFDLERVKWSDRCFDVGRIAGELQHFFMRTTGNKYDAEKFIGHFLWEYSCHFPDREQTFRAITARVPFYMGTTLLRIARNDYLGREYRRRLIAEAMKCLRRK